MSIFDNPERGKLIIRAIKECVAVRDDVTFNNVAAKLAHYPAFDLLAEEVSEGLGHLGGTDEAQPQPSVTEAEGATVEDVQRALGGTRHVALLDDAPKPKPPITQAQARRLIEEAHKRLGNARVGVKLAQQKQADAKARLGLAIQAWQTQTDPLTREQRQQREIRNHLASEQQRKHELAAMGFRGQRMDTSKHPAMDPTTGRMGTKGNRRGAFPASFQNRSINDTSAFQGSKPGVKA